MTSDQNPKNIIDMAAARLRTKKRATRAGASSSWNNGSGRHKGHPKQGKLMGTSLSQIGRWLQFFIFLAIATYVLKQCGAI